MAHGPCLQTVIYWSGRISPWTNTGKDLKGYNDSIFVGGQALVLYLLTIVPIATILVPRSHVCLRTQSLSHV